MIITIVLTVLLLTLLCYMIIPQLIFTIGQLIKQIPPGVKKLTLLAEEQFNNVPMSREIIENFAAESEEDALKEAEAFFPVFAEKAEPYEK